MSVAKRRVLQSECICLLSAGLVFIPLFSSQKILPKRQTFLKVISKECVAESQFAILFLLIFSCKIQDMAIRFLYYSDIDDSTKHTTIRFS